MGMSRQESGRLGGLAKAVHAGPVINVCKECRKKFTPRLRGTAGRAQLFCSRSCSLRWQHREGSRKGWTWQKKGLAAIEIPSSLDIAWAGGIYEGEGWGFRGTTQGVFVGQKDRWLLDRLVALFGGSITKTTPKVRSVRGFPAKRPASQFIWHIHGARARGFLMTVYKFLSPRRQAQVKKVLGDTISLEQT